MASLKEKLSKTSMNECTSLQVSSLVPRQAAHRAGEPLSSLRIPESVNKEVVINGSVASKFNDSI